MSNDSSKDPIYEVSHRADSDTEKINRAIKRVEAGDDRFVVDTLHALQDLRFPAFKHTILEHIKKKTGNADIVGLIESLDGYIEFKDVYHVQKAIKQNGEKYKLEHQISDETRKNPNFNVRPAKINQGIKEREVVAEEEERTDYPEIPPTARRDYVCDFCGTPFLTPDDLARHKRFEGSDNADNTRAKGLVAQRVGDMTGEPPDAKSVNRDLTAHLANVLENLKFPVTKTDIQNYIRIQSPSSVRKHDVISAVERLRDNVRYNNVYEISLDAGLVKSQNKKVAKRKGKSRSPSHASII